MSNDFHERDSALNLQLQQLVEEVNQFSATDDSPIIRAKRRIALNRLVNAIQFSGRLSKQAKWLELPNHQDYYNEALQKTLIEICERINQYNPQYPVMAWVNQIFNWRFEDVVAKEKKKGLTQVPKNQEMSAVLSLDNLQEELTIEDEISDEEQLKQIIEVDTENYLTNEIIQGHPQASLKAILLLLLSGKKWKEISEELGVPMTTASSFYQRRVRKIIAYIKKYI
ncbi:sigma-70 family RNA polymerase sigma factor [Brunnivagina elsteri]|uniref:RNA polymerase subunit sigma-24 n=1 Tax=Brunnivagina elsteri CCALA 953 TaxID=987040 RepID=A0A2A2THZ1_9CYAN|nr:sigma-70 family RNA polymerase sigma factor [Calothrix elsteri]PAX53427.1 RNA polymerase subunit sigma-24 [Calothrix elsteri CCALA 953]